MITQTAQGLASRLGYGLGRCARFCLTDTNVVLRWIKRVALAGLLLFVALNFERGLVGGLVTLLIFGVCLIATMKERSTRVLSDEKSMIFSHHPSVPRDGPDGYGYYDGYGNFRGSSNPFDDE